MKYKLSTSTINSDNRKAMFKSAKHHYLILKLLLCVVFAAGYTAYCQAGKPESLVTISGRVVTPEGKPAEFINIVLKGTNYGDLTDCSGQFSFAAPAGEYILIAQSMLHQRIEQPINVPTTGTISLNDITISKDVHKLSEVVVTGQFAPQSIQNSVYRVRTINSERIVQSGATEVKDLLENELGIIFLNDLHTGESDIQLMGMSGQGVKILLDGVPVIDRGSNRQSLSQIDLNTIERIEIVEGPLSVQYGTDALAGVINMISRRGSFKGRWPSVTLRIVEGSVGDEYSWNGKGSRNIHGGMVYNHSSGWFAEANGTLNNFGGWQGNLTGRAKEWKARHQTLGQFGTGFRQEKSELWYRFNIMDETIYGPGEPNVLTNIATDQNFLSLRMTHQLHGSLTVNPNFTLSAMGSFQDLERQTQTTTYNTQTGDRRLTMGLGDQDISGFTNLFGRITATNRFSNNMTLQSGFEYRYDKGSGDRIQGTPSITDYAAFMSLEWLPIQRITIRPGVRLIRNSDYEAPPVIPSINTKISLSHNLDFRAGYARGFRSPALRELHFWFFNANHAIRGNQNLNAENSDSFTGSLSFRPLQNEKMRVNVALTGFYNHFDKLITVAQDVNNPGQHTFVNIDTHKTTGGTIEATLSLTNLNISAGFSQVGRYNRYSENLESPSFDWSPEINTSLLYRMESIRASFNLTYKYTGRRPFHELAIVDGANILRQAYIDEFHHADLTLNKGINSHINLQLGVRNIFDVTSIRNTAMAGGGHGSSGPTAIGYGRSWFAGIHLNF